MFLEQIYLIFKSIRRDGISCSSDCCDDFNERKVFQLHRSTKGLIKQINFCSSCKDCNKELTICVGAKQNHYCYS